MSIQNYRYYNDAGDPFYIPIKEEIAEAMSFEDAEIGDDPLPPGTVPRYAVLYREDLPYTFRILAEVPTLAAMIALPQTVDISGVTWKVIGYRGEEISFVPWLIETGPVGPQGPQGPQGVAGATVIKPFSKVLTPAQVRLLNTSPNLLVAATAGTIRMPLSWMFQRQSGTVLYTGTATFALSTQGNFNTAYNMLPVMPAIVLTAGSANTPTLHIQEIGYGVTSAINFLVQSVTPPNGNDIWIGASANPIGATADCPVKVTVWYMEFAFTV